MLSVKAVVVAKMPPPIMFLVCCFLAMQAPGQADQWAQAAAQASVVNEKRGSHQSIHKIWRGGGEGRVGCCQETGGQVHHYHIHQPVLTVH
jgi:hypothetical protein